MTVSHATRKRPAPDSPINPSKRAKSSKTATPQATPQANGRPARSTQAPPQSAPLNDPPATKLQAYVFGEGSAGELGLGCKNAIDVTAPRLNPNLSGVVSLATGGMHAAALTSDNRVLTWGVNDDMALGRDTSWDGGMRDMDAAADSDDEDSDLNPREAIPTAIPAGEIPRDAEIVQLAAGDSATFVLSRDGLVYGWGTFRDSNGVYGFTLDPVTDEIVKKQATPALIRGLRNIRSLSVGADFALALDSAGVVYAWGPGQQDQLGRRLLERRRHRALVPARVELPKRQRFVSVHACIDHAFAVDVAGDAWAWGLNNYAQTGIADSAGQEEASITVPRKVASLAGRRLRALHGGRHHSIAVTRAGECLVWGRMDGGQSGLDLAQLPLHDASTVLLDERGRPRILLRPTPVPIPGRCVHAVAGPDHCIAVTADGKAYSWGFNANYQCGQGTSDDILVAKLMNGKQIRDTKIAWAGAGGQYSMLAVQV